MTERTQSRATTPAACFDGGNSLLRLVGVGLRPTSAAVYRRDVADFLGWWGRDPAEAESVDVVRYLAERAATASAADRRLAALAHFYREGVSAGYWSANPTVGLARARRGHWRTTRGRS